MSRSVEVCKRCHGSKLVTLHFPGNEGVPEWDADDQPCPECAEWDADEELGVADLEDRLDAAFERADERSERQGDLIDMFRREY